jgi:hypothetical protein
MMLPHCVPHAPGNPLLTPRLAYFLEQTADKLKLMEEAMANPAMQAQLGGMM